MSSSGSAGGGNDPMAWLGLLKWSLNYVDGTSDASQASPMSDEDRAFLEKVMKEGIIDENERMKFILQEATNAIEFYNNNDDGDETKATTTTENLEELLQELRDIVEQIDYARAFCSLKGLPFLLGCIGSSSSEKTTTGDQTTIPLSIRVQCAAILSTVAQNNPHVQKELLELGACKAISDVFFSHNTPMKLKIKLMQAMSSIVRNNPLSENVFCNLPQSPEFILEGLQISHDGELLNSKTLFFLKALLTADDSTTERVNIFFSSIYYIIDHYLLMDNTNHTDGVAVNSTSTTSGSSNLREMALSMLEQLLQRELFDMSLDNNINNRLRKDALVAKAVQRIATIRAMPEGSEEKEFAQLELESWESFLLVLARK